MNTFLTSVMRFFTSHPDHWWGHCSKICILYFEAVLRFYGRRGPKLLWRCSGQKLLWGRSIPQQHRRLGTRVPNHWAYCRGMRDLATQESISNCSSWDLIFNFNSMRQHAGLRRKQKGKSIATNRSTQPWSQASDYQGIVREDCPSVWLYLSTFYFGSRRACAKTEKMHKSSDNRIHTSLCKQIVSLFSYFQLISTIWLPPAPISA